MSKQLDNRPVYCRECKSHKTFERNPDRDMKTESGLTFMLSWQCKVCGHTSLTSNQNYTRAREEVIVVNRKD